MKILCPHCNNWIDAKKKKCPVCGGDPFSDLEGQKTHKQDAANDNQKPSSQSESPEPSSPKDNKNESPSRSGNIFLRLLSIPNGGIILVIVVIFTVAGIYTAMEKHARTATNVEKKTSKKQSDFYLWFYNCQPPMDIEYIPPKDDQKVILKKQQNM